MLLENKTAVIYGGGGSVGGAVARAFAREGAAVFLAGRTRAPLDAVGTDIVSAGGTAETAEVDALDEDAVERFTAEVARRAGGIDVSFDATSHGDVHGVPLVEMSVDDFIRPVASAMRSQFVTGRAAARHMARRGAGVLMSITATTARQSIPHVGGTGVAFDAIESLCRQWACELGPLGIRVVWLLTTGLPEGLHADVMPGYGTGKDTMTRQELVAWMSAKTPMNRLTTLAELGDAAAFLASDRASATTAGAFNLTVGSAPTR